MAESTYHPKHINQVIELARNELAAMLTRQTAIDKKVRQLKRTLKALGELATTKPADDTTEISIANNHNGENSTKVRRKGEVEKVPPNSVDGRRKPPAWKKIHSSKTGTRLSYSSPGVRRGGNGRRSLRPHCKTMIVSAGSL